MKFKNYIVTIVVLMSVSIYSQNAITGYVTIENPKDWEQKVYLSQLDIDKKTDTTIATSSVDKNGYFAFDQSMFTAQNHIYKVKLNPLSPREKKTLSNTIENFKLFILSKNDTIHFKKGPTLFAEYTTNNKADIEWQRLKQFEARHNILSDDFDPKQYLLETKGYVKDSLHILLVKLISIKKLDDQKLLETDIKANPKYYNSLLKELKTSDLDPQTYAYLENKLVFLTQRVTQRNYQISLLINSITIVIIMILSIVLIKYRKNNTSSSLDSLSKQERAVKELIISGKTNKEIANELFISLSTVKTHISNIYSKLNVANRQELQLKK